MERGQLVRELNELAQEHADKLSALRKIPLVAGAGGVTVEPAMKTLSARAKISGLTRGAESFDIFTLLSPLPMV